MQWLPVPAATSPHRPYLRGLFPYAGTSAARCLPRRIASSAVILVSLLSSTKAAINPLNLGARLEGNRSQITFRVYSARATRIDALSLLSLSTQDTNGTPPITAIRGSEA